MRHRAKRAGILLALVAGLGMAATGCFVSPDPVAASAPVVSTGYYQPLYYNGYVVYYDNYGRPMYHANGYRYYVPNTYSYYHHYVRHYRSYRSNYYRWYRYRGHRYRRYRLRRRYWRNHRYRSRSRSRVRRRVFRRRGHH